MEDSLLLLNIIPTIHLIHTWDVFIVVCNTWYIFHCSKLYQLHTDISSFSTKITASDGQYCAT